MKSTARDILRVSAIALVAMVALPLAYRLWLRDHPQSTRLPLASVLRESVAKSRAALLKRPLADWTQADRTAAPDVHAWLTAHERIVLPWEWTAEAVRKDPAGHRALWRRILEEERGKVRRILSRLEDAATEDVRSLARELDDPERIAADRREPVLLDAIGVTWRHRELLKRDWPSWIPARARRWLERVSATS